MTAIAQTAGNVVASAGASKLTGTAGATITAGMPVYKDAADGNKYKPCRANVLATANCDGIALTNSSNGQPFSYARSGDINVGATLVVGVLYSVSGAVAGQIVPEADLVSGNYETILGVATTTSNLALDIHNSATVKA